MKAPWCCAALVAVVASGCAGTQMEAVSPARGACGVAIALPHVTIEEARAVAAKDAVPTHCRVAGVSRPTADSEIRFVVAVPLGAAWNGRYLQVGSGGFAGFLPEDAIRARLAQGYAVAGTDDGHAAAPNDARWALGHPERVVDYGHRALKETADAARAIVRAVAGRAAARSYFEGCSDGGREALVMAQRYPAEFDGIVAVAPAARMTRVFAGMAWNVVALGRAGFLAPKKLAAIEAAALRACGDEDGVVEDPPACRFDPASLRCAGASGEVCLTDAEIAAVRAIYDGPRNARGERIFPGLEPGAEAEPDSWDEWLTGGSPEKAARVESRMLAAGFFQSMVMGDPAFDLSRLDFDRDVARADRQLAPILNATSPDLSAFATHGKLVVVHGWSDPAIPARDSIAYYEEVEKAMGDPRAFFRLFLAPGMLHCGGGRGPNVVPALDAVVAWVERGAAPERLVARKHEEDDASKPVLRARPLCVYPERAVWDGAGDRKRAESWRCAR